MQMNMQQTRYSQLRRFFTDWACWLSGACKSAECFFLVSAGSPSSHYRLSRGLVCAGYYLSRLHLASSDLSPGRDQGPGLAPHLASLSSFFPFHISSTNISFASADRMCARGSVERADHLMQTRFIWCRIYLENNCRPVQQCPGRAQSFRILVWQVLSTVEPGGFLQFPFFCILFR